MNHVMATWVGAVESQFVDSAWKNFLPPSGAGFWSFSAFLMGTPLFWYLVERKRASRGASWKNAANYVFPKSVFDAQTARADIRSFFLHTIILVPLVFGSWAFVSIFLGIDVNRLLVNHFGQRVPLIASRAVIVFVQFMVLAITESFFRYWAHRIQHEIPVLWSFHRGHHSAEALSIFTGYRFSLGEYLTNQPLLLIYNGTVLGITSYVMGAPISPVSLSAFILYKAVTGLYESFCHSHVPISFGRFNYVLAGPVLHQIHHSAETRHHDRNYSVDITLWDWMFGSLYLPQGREQFRLGLEKEREENNLHLSLVTLHFEPFRHAVATIKEQGWRAFIPRKRV